VPQRTACGCMMRACGCIITLHMLLFHMHQLARHGFTPAISCGSVLWSTRFGESSCTRPEAVRYSASDISPVPMPPAFGPPSVACLAYSSPELLSASYMPCLSASYMSCPLPSLAASPSPTDHRPRSSAFRRRVSCDNLRIIRALRQQRDERGEYCRSCKFGSGRALGVARGNHRLSPVSLSAHAREVVAMPLAVRILAPR
jgi:hypothetical protein